VRCVGTGQPKDTLPHAGDPGGTLWSSPGEIISDLPKSGWIRTIEPGGPDRSYYRRTVNSPAPGMPSRVFLRISPSPYAEPFPHITNRCRRSQPACPGTNKTTSRMARSGRTSLQGPLRASSLTEQHVACLSWPIQGRPRPTVPPTSRERGVAREHVQATLARRPLCRRRRRVFGDARLRQAIRGADLGDPGPSENRAGHREPTARWR
jgi:hypothetical protein